MSTMMSITINAPATATATALDKKSSEVAFVRKAVDTAMTEFGRGNGTVTSGAILGNDTQGNANTSLGSWTYTASASNPPLREKPFLQCWADLEFLDRPLDGGFLVGRFDVTKEGGRRSFDVTDVPCGLLGRRRWRRGLFPDGRALHCRTFSRQFGRTSAPTMPQRVHTIRGPNVGTGTSSDHRSTLSTA
jgi:hypothetical protein